MKKIIFMLFLSVFTVGITTVTAQSVTVIKDSTIHKGSRTINNYGTVIENNGGTVNITQSSGTPRGGVTEVHHEVIVDKTKPEVTVPPSEDALAIHAIDAWRSIIIVIAIVGGVIGFMIVKNKSRNE